MTSFMYNGIKQDGTLYKGHYSIGPWTEQNKLPKNTICIYAKDYKRFPKIAGLNIKNESNMVEDYHENDRVYVKPSNPLYGAVKEAFEKQAARDAKRFAKAQ